MPKVSVIIPVYNAAEYISTCTNSLLAQTLSEMEFIFIDDHGHDDSIEIVKNLIAEHARRDQFIFSETPQNSGPGIARNIGIQVAHGEYVAFLDSDDWVECNMYEQLYSKAKQQEADLCYCNACMEQNGKKTVLSTPVVQQGTFSDNSRRFFLQYYKGSCWTYIYRHQFLQSNNISFPGGCSAEDSYFVCLCILAAQRTAHVDDPLYHYIIRNTSLTQTNNEGRYRDKVKTFTLLMQKATEYPDYKQEIEYIYIKKGFIVPMLNYIKNADNPQKKVLQENYDLMHHLIPDYTQNSYMKKDIVASILTLILHKTPHIAIFTLPLMLRFSRYNSIV